MTAIDWLSDVQGNVYPGFRKDHQAFALVSFPDRAAGRRWLAEVRRDVASGAEVAAFNRAFKLVSKRLGDESSVARVVSATWTNVAFSWAGLELLLGAAAVARFPAAFKNNRVPWCQERADAHALLLLASDRPEELDAQLARHGEAVRRSGVDDRGVRRGGVLAGEMRGREHFGFKDGASRIVLNGAGDAAQPGTPPADPGQFVLGAPDAAGDTAIRGPAWTRHGSYLAFMQLEQHVGAFRAAVAREAARLGVEPAELASRIVGRPRGETSATSPAPRFSHVGRAQPRWLPGGEAARRQILRRGIPYGERLADGQPDDGGRGLLFLAYQADLEQQFEHVWAQWLNNPDFPFPGAGRDPLAGQLAGPDPGAARAATVSGAGRPETLASPRLPPFVTPRYGGYFFAPSLPALLELAGESGAPTAHPPSKGREGQ